MAEHRRRADSLLAELHHARSTVREESERLESLRKLLTVAEKGQRFLQEAARAVQQTAHEQVSKVVTRCVRTVYGADGFDFKMDFERKRGRTEANISFLKEGHPVSPTMDTGGGLDVSAFALRLVAVLLTTSRRLLVMDEPFRFVNGREYQERVARLVPALAEELDFQLVIATDDDWLKECGKVIELGDCRDES